MDKIAILEEALKAVGLVARGGFHPERKDDLGAGTIILVGNTDNRMWEKFHAAPHHGDHPLDRWCEDILTPIALRLDARIVFPFTGPPWHPFQQWAMRAEDVFPSPIGPLIHPKHGQWHAYRAAFLFDEKLELPAPKDQETRSPCDLCDGQPCRTACPVHAIGSGQYDVRTCVKHISSAEGRDCLEHGCVARRACPVGADNLYQPAQAEFHMRAFLRANS